MHFSALIYFNTMGSFLDSIVSWNFSFLSNCFTSTSLPTLPLLILCIFIFIALSLPLFFNSIHSLSVIIQSQSFSCLKIHRILKILKSDQSCLQKNIDRLMTTLLNSIKFCISSCLLPTCTWMSNIHFNFNMPKRQFLSSLIELLSLRSLSNFNIWFLHSPSV